MPESSSFNNDFQLALLALVLQNKDAVVRLKSVENFQEVFDDPLSQTCVSIVRDFFGKYDNLPDRSQLLHELEQKGHINVQRAIQAAYDIVIQNPDWYVDQILAFSYFKGFRRRIEDSLIALSNDNLGKAQNLIKEAARLSPTIVQIGFNFFQNMEVPYAEDSLKVPTTISPLDDALGGGLSIGELGLVMAPPGVGKSMFLCFLGAQALLRGYKVVHFTFELSEERTRMRYESALTQIPINDLRNNFTEKNSRLKILQQNYSIGDNFFIIHHPTKTCTTSQINTHLDILADNDFVPHIILVDYLDIIRWTRTLEKRDGLEESTEGLRQIAGERNIPLWSATQSNKEAISKIVYGMESIADSFAKVRVTDVLVCICQTEEEKHSHLWRLFVAKNRNNPGGQEIQCEYDLRHVDLCIKSELLRGD